MKKIIIISIILIILLGIVTSCKLGEEAMNVEGVKMTAIIKNLDGKFEVEVIEGEYGASGLYWLNVSSDTVFTDENNAPIHKSKLKVGDTVEIIYDGKVMLSYPPQIVALKIQKIK